MAVEGRDETPAELPNLHVGTGRSAAPRPRGRGAITSTLRTLAGPRRAETVRYPGSNHEVVSPNTTTVIAMSAIGCLVLAERPDTVPFGRPPFVRSCGRGAVVLVGD